MNLLSTVERLAAIDRSAVRLDQSRCLHSLNRFSTCDACFELCPVEAIQVGQPPSLNEEACRTCLACLPACPVGAYTAHDAVGALLRCAARLEVRTIELICERHPSGELGLPDMDAAIRVKACLAGLGTGAYLALVALGLEKILARTDACDECPWGSLRPRIEGQVGGAQRLLEPWGLSDALACVAPDGASKHSERPLWRAYNPPLSRRDLFRVASQRGQVTVARALSAEDGGAGEGQLPRERRRVIAALAHLPAREPEAEVPTLEGLGFADVSVSADCTASGVCARACPTGALKYQQEEDVSYRLTFSPQRCVGCELCLHVCAPNAITIDHRPSFTDVFGRDTPVVLSEGELRRCDKCGVPMATKPGSRLCPVCEFRQSNPFGSMMPPGLRGSDTFPRSAR